MRKGNGQVDFAALLWRAFDAALWRVILNNSTPLQCMVVGAHHFKSPSIDGGWHFLFKFIQVGGYSYLIFLSPPIRCPRKLAISKPPIRCPRNWSIWNATKTENLFYKIWQNWKSIWQNLTKAWQNLTVLSNEYNHYYGHKWWISHRRDISTLVFDKNDKKKWVSRNTGQLLENTMKWSYICILFVK